MKNQDTQYKAWLEQYANGSISARDKGLLMEAIAAGRVDAVLEDELGAQWAANIHAGLAQGAPLPFEQSAVYQHLQDSQGARPGVRPVGSERRRSTWMAAAAVAAMVIIGGLWMWGPFQTDHNLLARVPAGYLQQTNEGANARNVQLPDGSVVTLLQGATVHYPVRFDGKARNVYLEGDAFFDVTHLDGMPFSVHGRAVSAEVLGTSFWVRQDQAHGLSEVEVRTGKVRVMANSRVNNESEASRSIVVLPNQQVAYQEEKGQLKLMLADSILPLQTPEATELVQHQHALRFSKTTRLEEVLAVISTVYGVHIELSTPDLNNCLVTGDLSKQDLLQSIEMICLSIGAKFELKEASIFIEGPGCSLK